MHPENTRRSLPGGNWPRRADFGLAQVKLAARLWPPGSAERCAGSLAMPPKCTGSSRVGPPSVSRRSAATRRSALPLQPAHQVPGSVQPWVSTLVRTIFAFTAFPRGLAPDLVLQPPGTREQGRSGSSRTAAPSSASPAPSWPSRTANGPRPAAIWEPRYLPQAASLRRGDTRETES
jgi:hypothetical protein